MNKFKMGDRVRIKDGLLTKKLIAKYGAVHVVEKVTVFAGQAMYKCQGCALPINEKDLEAVGLADMTSRFKREEQK